MVRVLLLLRLMSFDVFMYTTTPLASLPLSNHSTSLSLLSSLFSLSLSLSLFSLSLSLNHHPAVIFANTIENIQYFNILYRYNILTAVFLIVSTGALIAEPIMIITRKRCSDKKEAKQRGGSLQSLSKGAGQESRAE